MKVTVVQGSSEWSALYVDGKLDRVGDHYIIDERIQQIFGVGFIQSDEFLQGGNSYDNCLQTLNEVHKAIKARQDRLDIIENLRHEADELLARAQEMEEQ